MATQADVDLQAALARRLKAARALSGKKVREVAGELGWSEEKLYRLERGEGRSPTVQELAEIARATGQSLEFFFSVTSAEPQERGTLPSPLPGVNLDDDGEDEAAA